MPNQKFPTQRIIFLSITTLFTLGFFLSSCEEKSTERHYTEIHIASPLESMSKSNPHVGINGMDMMKKGAGDSMAASADMVASSKASVPLAWETPSSWAEMPGQGLRMATFKSNTFDDMDASIVSLGGMAGGIEANIKRWLGQIGITNVDDKQFSQFIANLKSEKNKAGMTLTWVDLTEFLKDAKDDTPNMFAVIVTTSDSTIFVKLTGKKATVAKEKTNLVALAKSLKLK